MMIENQSGVFGPGHCLIHTVKAIYLGRFIDHLPGHRRQVYAPYKLWTILKKQGRHIYRSCTSLDEAALA